MSTTGAPEPQGHSSAAANRAAQRAQVPERTEREPQYSQPLGADWQRQGERQPQSKQQASA